MTATIFTIAGRAGLGFLLALVLSYIGVWVAWGLYYFFTDTSSKLLRDVMFLAGAAVGAGLGSSLTWLRLDGNSLPVVLLMGATGLAGGIIGSWMGYEYALNREIKCCSDPPINAFSYAALGATVAANAGTFLLGTVREIVNFRR